MFKVSDFRMTGMPTLGTTATAEGAWALAETLGIREHAFVEPVTEEAPGWSGDAFYSYSGVLDLAAIDAERSARYVDQLALALVAPVTLSEAA